MSIFTTPVVERAWEVEEGNADFLDTPDSHHLSEMSFGQNVFYVLLVSVLNCLFFLIANSKNHKRIIFIYLFLFHSSFSTFCRSIYFFFIIRLICL